MANAMLAEQAAQAVTPGQGMPQGMQQVQGAPAQAPGEGAVL
jgi:hypothetical protein